MNDDVALIGRLAEWYKAQDRLAAMAARLEAWAGSVGHDASKLIVPKWARPVFTQKAAVAGTPEVQQSTSGVLFDIPTIPKKSKAKARVLRRDAPQGTR